MAANVESSQIAGVEASMVVTVKGKKVRKRKEVGMCFTTIKDSQRDFLEDWHYWVCDRGHSSKVAARARHKISSHNPIDQVATIVTLESELR